MRPSIAADREQSRRSFAQLHSAMKDQENKDDRRAKMLKSKSGYGSKSFMVSADGNVSYLTPAEMGRRELHENIPMHAVMGLQKKERSMSMAFASFAADLDVLEQEKSKDLSFTEKISHKSQASLMLMDEMEMHASVVSTPLIFAVLVATLTQLLVGKHLIL